ncbi:MAG: sugar phosphate isomerase/epimerase family protein [Bryobacteraceae bacterium]
MNRRQFLTSAAAFAAASASLRAAAKPDVAFPTEPRKRLSVSTYPFRHVVRRGGMTLQQFAATIPDKFQVHGIEPWGPHFQSTEPVYVRQLKDAFDRAGVHVVNIPVDARVHPCSASPEERQASLQTWRNWVDVAVGLRSPSIRVHLPSLHADPACVVGTMKALADYGEKKGIVVNMENDDPRSEDAFRIVSVIEVVNSPFLRALPDFANSRQRGDAAYDYRAVAAMFAHAYNISHVKDEEVVNGKVLRVSLARTFAIAKKAGYRGYFSMEFDGPGDPYAGTKALLEASLKNLA